MGSYYSEAQGLTMKITYGIVLQTELRMKVCGKQPEVPEAGLLDV